MLCYTMMIANAMYYLGEELPIFHLPNIYVEYPLVLSTSARVVSSRPNPPVSNAVASFFCHPKEIGYRPVKNDARAGVHTS